MITIHDLIGILGVVLLLLAYLLLQINKLKSEQIAFPLLNLFGSLMILLSLFYDWNLSAVIIEISWALISIYGIIKIKSRGK